MPFDLAILLFLLFATGVGASSGTAFAPASRSPSMRCRGCCSCSFSRDFGFAYCGETGPGFPGALALIGASIGSLYLGASIWTDFQECRPRSSRAYLSVIAVLGVFLFLADKAAVRFENANLGGVAVICGIVAAVVPLDRGTC